MSENETGFSDRLKKMDRKTLDIYHTGVKRLIYLIAFAGISLLMLGLAMSEMLVWIPIAVFVFMLAQLSSGVSVTRKEIENRISEMPDK